MSKGTAGEGGRRGRGQGARERKKKGIDVYGGKKLLPEENGASLLSEEKEKSQNGSGARAALGKNAHDAWLQMEWRSATRVLQGRGGRRTSSIAWRKKGKGGRGR